VTAEKIRVIANYLRMLGSFLLGLVLVRLLLNFGSDAYATIILLTAGVGLGLLLQEMARSSVTPVLGAAYHGQDSAGFLRIYHSALVLCSLAGLATLLVFTGFLVCLDALQIPVHLVGAAKVFVLARAAQSVVSILLAPLINMFVVQEKMVAYNWWLFVERCMDLVAVLALFALPRDWQEPATVIALYGVLTAVLSTACYVLAARQILASQYFLKPSFRFATRQTCRKVALEGLGNSAVVLANNLYLRLDIIIMNSMFGLFGSLVFGIASQLVCYVRMAAMGFVIGLDAVAARIANRKDNSGMCELVRRTTRQQASIVFPATIVLSVVAEQLTSIWVGARLDETPQALGTIVTLVRVLAVGIAARCIGEGWGVILAGAGHIGRYSVPALLTSLSNPLIIFVLMPLFPVALRYSVPAIVFSSLSIFIYQLVLPVLISRSLRINLRDVYQPMFRPLVAALLALPALILTRIQLTGDVWSLVVAVISYALAYTFFYFILVLDQPGRAAMVGFFKRRVPSGRLAGKAGRQSAAMPLNRRSILTRTSQECDVNLYGDIDAKLENRNDRVA